MEYKAFTFKNPSRRPDSNFLGDSARFYFPLFSDVLILVLILILSFASPSVSASGTRRNEGRNSGLGRVGGGIIIFPTQPFLQKTAGLSPGPKIGYLSVESRSRRNFQEIQEPLPKEAVGRGEIYLPRLFLLNRESVQKEINREEGVSELGVGTFSGCGLKTPFSSNQSALNWYESHGCGGEWGSLEDTDTQIDRNVIHMQKYLSYQQ